MRETKADVHQTGTSAPQPLDRVPACGILKQMRTQYSLQSLVGAVVASALFFAIAIRPPIQLGSISLTIAVGLLFAAVLESVFRSGEERYFWTAFSIVGWGYLVLVFCDSFKTEVGSHLLTSHLLAWLHDGMPKSRGTGLVDFERFGQSLITLLVALVGGLAGRHYFRMRPTAGNGPPKPL